MGQAGQTTGTGSKLWGNAKAHHFATFLTVLIANTTRPVLIRFTTLGCAITASSYLPYHARNRGKPVGQVKNVGRRDMLAMNKNYSMHFLILQQRQAQRPHLSIEPICWGTAWFWCPSQTKHPAPGKCKRSELCSSCNIF
jgi:hypothetical protein